LNAGSTKLLKAVLAISLLLSAALGAHILATDAYLWAEAPSHAYGLVAFVVIDMIAAAGMFGLPRVTRIVAFLLPVIQLAAMGGDFYMGLGSPGSLIQESFRDYLLNDVAFMILLVLQAVVVGFALTYLVQSRTNPNAARAVAVN